MFKEKGVLMEKEIIFIDEETITEEEIKELIDGQTEE